MKKSNGFLLACLLAVITTMSSCAAVKGLVGFGFWLGIGVVVLIIIIVFWLKGRSK